MVIHLTFNFTLVERHGLSRLSCHNGKLGFYPVWTKRELFRRQGAILSKISLLQATHEAQTQVKQIKQNFMLIYIGRYTEAVNLVSNPYFKEQIPSRTPWDYWNSKWGTPALQHKWYILTLTYIYKRLLCNIR